MATRLPLVLGADGLPQQLQTGDQIAAPTTTTTIRQMSNAEASAAIVIGTPVYSSAADAVKRGQANAKATGKLVGLVYDVSIAAGATGNIATSGVLVATTAQWDAVVTGETGGLTFGASYFLDPANVGKLTSTPASTPGQVNTFVGTGVSATELEIELGQPILL